MTTRALLRLSAYLHSRRRAPWRPLPGPQPLYEWDLSDIYSMLCDMYLWMDYNHYNKPALQSSIQNGIDRYFFVVRYHRRKEIINETLTDVADALDAVDSGLEDAYPLLRELAKLERRGRLHRAGYTHQDLVEQKKIVKQLRMLRSCWETLDGALAGFNEAYDHLEWLWRGYAQNASSDCRRDIERVESILEVRYDERSVFKGNIRYGINDGCNIVTELDEERGRSSGNMPIGSNPRSERTSTPSRESAEYTSEGNNEASSSGDTTRLLISPNASQTASQGRTSINEGSDPQQTAGLGDNSSPGVGRVTALANPEQMTRDRISRTISNSASLGPPGTPKDDSGEEDNEELTSGSSTEYRSAEEVILQPALLVSGAMVIASRRAETVVTVTEVESDPPDASDETDLLRGESEEFS